MKVKTKINSLNLGKNPYFFPLLKLPSTPVWKYPSILVAFDSIPKYMSRLPLDYNATLIMVESGGYIPNPPSSPEECLQRQINVFPDLVLTLDYPVKKGRGGDLPVKEKEKRVEKTIQNAKKAMELKNWVCGRYNRKFELVAVIQGYDIPSIRRCAMKMQSFGYEYYALGSVTTQASSRKLPEIKRVLGEVRDIIGKNAWLHILGVMDVNVLHPIKDYITSFDASTITQLATKGTGFREDGTYVKIPLHVHPDYIERQQKIFSNYLKFYEKYLWTDV